MATSGNILYTTTRDDIITEALELIGVLGTGQTPDSADVTSCSRTLNMMIKSWQADGLALHTIKQTYLFLVPGQQEYSLHAATSDHWTSELSTTTLSVGAALGAASVTVTEVTGITDNDYIGVYLDTGVMHWTQVNGAPAGSVVSLDVVLPAAASSGAVVYHYTSKAGYPVKIVNAFHHEFNSTDLEVDLINRAEYWGLGDKASSGTVLQVYFDDLGQSPKLRVWPTASNGRNYLILFVQRVLENFDAAVDNPDFPQEWFLPLAYNLALLVAPKFSIPSSQMELILMKATEWYAKVKEADDEVYTRISIRPDMRF